MSGDEKTIYSSYRRSPAALAEGPGPLLAKGFFMTESSEDGARPLDLYVTTCYTPGSLRVPTEDNVTQPDKTEKHLPGLDFTNGGF